MRPAVLLLLLLLAGRVAAQDVLGAQPAPNPRFPDLPANPTSPGWPGRSPIRFRTEPHRGTWDGMPVAYLRLTAGALDLLVGQKGLEYWRIRPETPYGFAASYWWHNDVSAYVAAFEGRPGFLPSLEEKPWLAFVTGVARSHGRIRPVLRINDSSTDGGVLRVMGHPTRVLAFDVPPAVSEERLRTVIQVFVELPAHLLVIGLEGPADEVPNAVPAFNDLLLNLEPYPVSSAATTPPAPPRRDRDG